MQFSGLSDSQKFCDEARRRLSSVATEWSKVLRIDCLISPKQRNDIVGLKRPRTWKEYLRLILVHWYLPDESRTLVHVELEEIKYKFGTEKSSIAHMLLNSEPEMIIYLLETSHIFRNPREFFGFILMKQDLSEYHFRILRPRKAKETIRRRGYKDKGSRRLPHELHGETFQDFTKEQNRIEEERELQEFANELARGFFQ